MSVLWVVTGLSLLAAATETLTANSYKLERRALSRAQAEAILYAGITQAVLGVAASNLSDRWRVDGTPRVAEFDGIKLRVSVQDELGRFDINAIDGSMLTSLLRTEGVSHDDAATLTDRILDWREVSQGDLHRLHGATDADYASAGRSYRPRHGPFQTVDELQLVLGMTPDLFVRIRPALTVYTKRPMIEPTFATKEALLALYGGDGTKVDDVIRARQKDATESAGQTDPVASQAGHTFSIAVDVDVDRHHYSRNVVVMLTADERRPFVTLSWR